MKTLITSTNKNSFRNIIAGLTLSAAFFFGGAASAQTTVQFVDKAPIHTQTTNAFKVAVFPVANSLLMKVHFENPNKEKVTLLIKNSKDEVVYRKAVGNDPIFNGKFDLSKIANGTYIMVIQSSNQTYSNSFAIETHQERIAKAL